MDDRQPGADQSLFPLSRRHLLAGFGGVTVLGTSLLVPTSKAEAATTGNALPPGRQLNPGEQLVSGNGRFSFVMQKDDGNGVLYRNPMPTDNRRVPLWATRSDGHPGAYLANQKDGHVVCYTPGASPGWSFASGTNGRGVGDLVLQDDGNLVRLGGPHGWVWASGTDGGRSNLTNPAGVLAPWAEPGSDSRAESAIAWFTARLGSTRYEGMCEKAVENAYGVTGRYASAIANWQDRQARSQSRTPYQSAPRGSLVFYNTPSRYKHVAISLGDGRVVSTSVKRRIGIAPIGYFQRPMGWAPSPW